MNLTQAKNVLKKYWPNPSISRRQLLLLSKKFKKNKLWNPKLSQAANVLLQKNTVINDNVIYKNPIKRKIKMKPIKYYQIQGYYCNRWEDVSAYDNKKEALVDIKKYRENEHTGFRLIVRREKITTINKNPLPPGLIKAGQFGGKILARRAGAAGLAFGAGPVAGALTTTAGVILTGRDLYKYVKMLRKNKKATKTKRKTVKKNPVKKIIKIKVKRKIGYRIADIGKGGKEYNVKTSKHWKKRK